MWRFKTEKELEQEYGNNWRSNLAWCGDMDYLFGLDIANPTAENVISMSKIRKGYTKNWYSSRAIENSNWTVTIHMITNKNPLIPIEGFNTISNEEEKTINPQPNKENVRNNPIEVQPTDFQISRGNKLSGQSICY